VRQAVHQWNICSDDNQYRGLCLDCDRALNRLVLEWVGFADVEEKMHAYDKKLAKLADD
jgi:hypothetical protein